jgi:tRNA G18 (ribose-2'-O)-methylase SpoU
MPLIVPVDDPADPRIAAYRDIRERDLVGRGERFIAEGKVVVRVLLESSPYRVESLLIAAPRLTGVEPLLSILPDDVPVYAASQPVLDAIAGFPVHRGVLAVGRRGPAPDADGLLARLADRAVVVGLVGIANHDNMGGILRNAAAFGADAVILAADCCDPLYRKAIRVSVGASLIVPTVRLAPGADIIDLLARHDIVPVALAPHGAADLAELSPGHRTALLFGSEGPGLPDGILARCRTVRISMARGFDSLNVATASGIVLHHVAALR